MSEGEREKQPGGDTLRGGRPASVEESMSAFGFGGDPIEVGGTKVPSRAPSDGNSDNRIPEREGERG